MIDLITQAVDRLVSLCNVLSQRKRDLFLNHVEPLYQDLLLVHKDYKAGIREIRETCAKGKLKQLIAFVTQRRKAFQPLRVKVYKLSEALRKSHAESADRAGVEVYLFARITCGYFEGYLDMGILHPHTEYTAFIQMLRAIGDDSHPKVRQLRIEKGIDRFENRIDFNWELITKAYVKVRTTCM